MKGIIKADERLKARPKVNIAMFGQSGVGKTTQARTLDAKSTLFLDLEGGTLALQDWAGDVVDIRKLATDVGAHPWEMTRALALFVGGADPADSSGAYSATMFEQIANLLGGAKELEKYSTIYIDSITVASRWCFSWGLTQPEAFSQKTGKQDTLGAYGLLGREMIKWLTHLQHSPKSIVVVGILDRMEDDLKRVSFVPQIEGSKAAREIAGIFDQVLTLDYVHDTNGKPIVTEGKKSRCFYCTQDNGMGFPAKDRSGRLEELEPPDLGALIHKIHTGKRLDSVLTTTI
jgi:hypothetical protein